MTRINVGVPPSELCDQHLVAEYRELPRLWSFRPKSPAPPHFCLGRGHVLWCAQYPGMLAARYLELVAEMRHRGFKVSYPRPPEWAVGGAWPGRSEVRMAAAVVRVRLGERLREMRGVRWTRR